MSDNWSICTLTHLLFHLLLLCLRSLKWNVLPIIPEGWSQSPDNLEPRIVLLLTLCQPVACVFLQVPRPKPATYAGQLQAQPLLLLLFHRLCVLLADGQ